jgi:hypothetical protein
MTGAAEVKMVLLDASVPHRFCDAHLLIELMKYFGDSAWITPEVETELRRSASGRRYAGLRVLELAGAGGWPKVTDVLPQELRREYRDLKRAAQQPGDPPDKHIGEITTVLMAARLRADLVVVDDRFGTALARQKGLVRLSTAQLALDMVRDGSLSEDEGFAVFDCATDDTVGRPRYEQALREWRLRAES